jgi:hypothetical protein
LISTCILGIFLSVFPLLFESSGYSGIGFRFAGAGGGAPIFLGFIPINFCSSSSLNIPHIV